MHPGKISPCHFGELISANCNGQSVYADIALSLGEYLRDRYWPQMRDHGLVISDMVIEKALIAALRGPQLLRTTVELSQTQKCAKCRFLTVEVNFSILTIAKTESR